MLLTQKKQALNQRNANIIKEFYELKGMKLPKYNYLASKYGLSAKSVQILILKQSSNG